MFNAMKFSHRIMLFVGIALCALAVALTLANRIQFASAINDAEQRELRGYFKAIEASMAAESRLAVTLSALVAGMPPVQQAMADGNREQLMEWLGPAYQALSENYGAKQFQFHTPPATSFLRVHQPQKFGDDLSSFRHTVVRANETRRDTRGLESGVAGVGIRGVVPVVQQGKHLGSVEFGMSFGQSFFDQVKESYGIEAALHFVSGGKLDTFAATLAEKRLLDEDVLKATLKGEPHLAEFERKGVPYAVYAAPIKDFSGEPVAVLELAMDRSGYAKALSSGQALSVTIALAALALCLVVARFVAQGLARPLTQAVAVMDGFARGELRQQLDESHINASETGQLLGALQRMGDQLRGDIEGIAKSARELNDEAAHLSQKAEETSQETARQENQIGQVATSITQMSASVQEVASSAAKVVDATNKAAREAQNGRTVVMGTIETIGSLSEAVTQVAAAIQQLAESSQAIGGVVEVINEIADQTNLLALNAAIEAARAGEQGRGFAVVADEVRTLAQRTQESTHEIRNMIERVQQGASEAVRAMEQGRATVDASVKRAANAGELLQAITQSVEVIMDMNHQIATAAEEQSTVTEEISRRIEEISAAARHTAGATSYTAEASEKLVSLASALDKTIARFRA